MYFNVCKKCNMVSYAIYEFKNCPNCSSEIKIRVKSDKINVDFGNFPNSIPMDEFLERLENDTKGNIELT